MTSDEAVAKLAESTAEAATSALALCAGDDAGIEVGAAVVVPNGASATDELVVPAVVTSVSYVDGVRGGNLFVISSLGARRLAASMRGAELPDDAGGEPTELDISAVSEAMSQMMTGAASATSAVLEQEVRVGPPQTLPIQTAAEAAELIDRSAIAITTPFTVFGEPARLIQLVPNAFVVRMTNALAGLAAEAELGQAPDEIVPGEMLQEVEVRLSAELGRFTMGVARAVSMSPGSVVELEAAADEPVDLFVNGLPFGEAQLVITEDGSWGVRLERIYALEAISSGKA